LAHKNVNISVGYKKNFHFCSAGHSAMRLHPRLPFYDKYRML